MKRIENDLADEMTEAAFGERLDECYVRAVRWFKLSQDRVVLLFCDGLAFKYWVENNNHCNSYLEDGDSAFDSASWEFFVKQIGESGYYAASFQSLNSLEVDFLNQLIVSVSKFISHRHYDAENERVVRAFFKRRNFPIWGNTSLAEKVRYVLAQYRRKSYQRLDVPCDDMVQMQSCKMSCLGVDESIRFVRRTLYFDETGNDNKVHLLKGKLNLPNPGQIFVLGGLEVREPITEDELKAAFGRTTEKEVKSSNFLGGDFVSVLGKENFSKLLKLIETKGWFVNFFAAQPFYFGLVDVIDSLNCYDRYNHFELKQTLVDVLSDDIAATTKMLIRFNYPDVDPSRKNEFLDQLIGMVSAFQSVNSMRFDCVKLINALEEGKGLDELPFIQEGTRLILLGDYFPFYLMRMATYPTSRIVFDGKDDLFAKKEQIRYTYQRTELDWRPADSEKEPMLQLCDYVVSVLQKFFLFADRAEAELKVDLNALAVDAKDRLKRFVAVLQESMRHNPLSADYALCIRTYNRIAHCINLINCNIANEIF